MNTTRDLRTPCYAGGSPYRPLYSPHSGRSRPRDCRRDKVIALSSPELGWARFWEIISSQLERHAYSNSSRELYRNVLRGFYRKARCAPASVTGELIAAHLNRLVAEHYSWNWIGMNISVLRSVFDKLGGQALATRFMTPKRPMHLPEILSPGEIRQLLAAATTTRDQLLLGLLYGCGLKVGEVRQLTWSAVDAQRGHIRVRHARGRNDRTLPIPPELLPVLKAGAERCPPADYIFQGRVAGTPLSARMVQLILRKAVNATNILKTVTCMTLRHSFAVHCIEKGDSIRAVQEALGHESVDTTLLYERCILPRDATSPLDRLRQQTTPPTGENEPNPQASDGSLFDKPLSVTECELPFRDTSSRNPAREFYSLLKTQIIGRFLCRRRGTIRAG